MRGSTQSIDSDCEVAEGHLFHQSRETLVMAPHTLTSTKRTSKINTSRVRAHTSPEVQICQLIQILERLKVTCFHQSRESLVVPIQQNRTGQFLAKRNIEFLQLNKAADWLEGPYTETESE